MSYKPKPAKSGRIIDESGNIQNIVDVLGGAMPLSSTVYDPDTFPAQSGRVIGEDGQMYSLIELLQNAGGGSVGWGDITGKPSTFPPSTHSHPIDQVTGLQTALDSKLESVAWGDVTGKPSTFAPSAHTHTIADIETLQSMLDDILSRLAALEGG